MKLVIFGLTVSSSWGNGHATIWRGLIAALARRGHRVEFFEKDVPFYASSRDLTAIPHGELVLYRDWEQVRPRAERTLRDADAAIVTSYCPDGVAACHLVLDSSVPVKCFYDLDTPITLERTRAQERVEYLPPEGLGGFDLVLSFTGGRALDELEERFGARRTAALYGSVDPLVHQPVEPVPMFQGDFSYLDTYAANRQEKLEQLFLAPARRLSKLRFMLGGSQYPAGFPWQPNVFYFSHVAPVDHPGFYCSSALTLNITRAPMAAMGFCPSGRLFEAAACGVPVLSDPWEGLATFFEPGREILIAHSTEEAVEAISLPRDRLLRIARAARERVLEEHTAQVRAEELLEALADAQQRPARSQPSTEART